jgi:glycosyltransferase involved in cell wall biosynthesis
MVRRRGVIVVSPAWHSCGSYEVFKQQLKACGDLGRSTFFLSVAPTLSLSRYSGPFWRHYYEMTLDVQADYRAHTARYFFPFRHRAFWREIAPGLQRTLSYWRALPAKLAPLPHNMRRFIDTHEIDAIICNHFFNMPLAVRLKRLTPNARIILETHDIQSLHYRDRELRHPLTGRRDDFEVMFAEEIGFARDAEILVHLNEDEAKLFRERLPSHRHELIFPSMPRAYNSSRRLSITSTPFDFLIVASANQSNYTNVRWFLSEVWSPAFDQRFRLKIVGNVDHEFLSRSDPLYDRYRHCFVGRAPALDSYYYNARAVLLPVVVGHGIGIKTIEAMSYGKPIIATPAAFRGFAGRIPPSLIEGSVDSAEEFRSKMASVDGTYPTIDQRMIQVYEMLFSPEAYTESYKRLVTDSPFHESKVGESPSHQRLDSVFSRAALPAC